MNQIEWLSKAALRSARGLLRRKTRLEKGEFIAEGAQAVREALAEGYAKLLIVNQNQPNEELVQTAFDTKIRIVKASDEVISQLSDTVTPQGVIAICSNPAITLDQLVDEPKLIVICADIRDPGNAGTVIRCADAFGADAVILTNGSVELTNPKTVRASVGSIFHLPIVTQVSVADALAWAKTRQLLRCGADANGADLYAMQLDGKLKQPTAWVMGNEAWGLPDQIRENLDEIVAIPMWGKAESLNLSTAAAILLFTSATQLRR